MIRAIVTLLTRGVIQWSLLSLTLWCAPATLQIRLDSQRRIVLQWTNAGPVSIESASQLSPAHAWQTLGQALDLANKTAILEPTLATQFYRLRDLNSLIRVASTSPEAGGRKLLGRVEMAQDRRSMTPMSLKRGNFSSG